WLFCQNLWTEYVASLSARLLRPDLYTTMGMVSGSGGLVTRFELSWPEQRAAQVMRGPHGPLQPVRIVVDYSQGFLHPHLSGSTAGFWPFQVTSAADAGRQRGILAAIVELELHQRIFETDWRILPVSWQLE